MYSALFIHTHTHTHTHTHVSPPFPLFKDNHCSGVNNTRHISLIQIHFGERHLTLPDRFVQPTSEAKMKLLTI